MMLLPVELSPTGFATARTQLEEAEALLAGSTASGKAGKSAVDEAGGGQQPNVVAVYEHARTVPNSHTSKLLELFARKDPLTPEEIGIELGGARPFTKSQGRAFVRNLSRMQGTMLKRGRISGPVLEKHFSGYEQEGAGRYGLSGQDRAALRAHLAN